MRLDRWARWLLGLTLLLYFVSGYGLSAGIMNRPTARWLHSQVLAIPTLLAVLVHVGAGLRVQLVRWRQDKNIFLNVVLYAALAVSVGYFFLLEIRAI